MQLKCSGKCKILHYRECRHSCAGASCVLFFAPMAQFLRFLLRILHSCLNIAERKKGQDIKVSKDKRLSQSRDKKMAHGTNY